MKCKQCNVEIPDGVKFCPSCGASTSGEQPKPSEAPKAAPANAGSNGAGANKSVTLSVDPSAAVGFLKKNKKAAIGAAAAVVVVVVAIIAFVMVSSNVPEDIVKNDLMENNLVKNGAVQSDYVNSSNYQISEFKITGQSDEKLSNDLLSLVAKTATGVDKVRKVNVSGKVANDNFETSFSGYFYYVKSGDKWSKVDSDIDASSTKPLKGVDKAVSSSSSSSDSVSYSDFSSTLEESDGAYVSVATQKVQYSYWFADDTATSASTFKFDQSKGWVRQGNPELSDTNTAWKLGGKTFAVSGNYGFFSVGTKNVSVTFGDCSGETANATYSIGFTPTKEKSGSTEYHAIDLKGSASGSLSHDFSKSSFSMQLNDAGNAVTFTFSGNVSSTTTSAGEGTVHTLSGRLVTKAVYGESSSSEYTFDIDSNTTFTEKTTV